MSIKPYSLPFLSWDESVLFPNIETSVVIRSKDQVRFAQTLLDKKGDIIIRHSASDYACLAKIVDYDSYSEDRMILRVLGVSRVRLTQSDWEIHLCQFLPFPYEDQDRFLNEYAEHLKDLLEEAMRRFFKDADQSDLHEASNQVNLLKVLHQMSFSLPMTHEQQLEILASRTLRGVLLKISQFLRKKP